MMNFPTLVAHQDVVVLMENVASHSFASFAFANTFGLKAKKGNGDQVLADGHINSMLRIQHICRKHKLSYYSHDMQYIDLKSA